MLSTAPGSSWRVLHGFGQATLRALLRELAPILRGGCRVTTLSSTDRGCATVVSGFVTKRPTHASRQHALWLHLPTTLLSITLETTLTTSLAHSLRSPLRALAPDRKGVHFFSDRVSLIAIQVWSKEPTKKNNAHITVHELTELPERLSERMKFPADEGCNAVNPERTREPQAPNARSSLEPSQPGSPAGSGSTSGRDLKSKSGHRSCER